MLRENKGKKAVEDETHCQICGDEFKDGEEDNCLRCDNGFSRVQSHTRGRSTLVLFEVLPLASYNYNLAPCKLLTDLHTHKHNTYYFSHLLLPMSHRSIILHFTLQLLKPSAESRSQLSFKY